MLEIIAAWRGLLKHRAGVALAIVALAIASSSAALVFTVVNAVLVRPLPIADAARVAIIWEKRKSEPGKYGVSGADFYDWQSGAAPSIESMTAQDEHSMILAGSEPRRVMAVLSTAGFFETFGVSPVLGSIGDGRGAFLSCGLWQRRFGGDLRIAGQKIQLDGMSYEIAGVLPADFRMFFGRAPADVYLPLEMPPQLRQSRDDHSFFVTARLRAGASFRELSDELDIVNARLQHEFPKTNTGHDALVIPVTTEVTASARAPLMMLSGAVALLLLLACANVANLLLARNQARSQEMAIRQALGAALTDSAKLVLAESLMLSLAAGLAGLIAARLAVPLMRAIVPRSIGPVILPGLDRLEIDSTVMLFSAAVCGFMALAGAIVPLRRLNAPLSRWRSTKPQRILAIAQIAIACALSTGGVALLMSYGRLMKIEPGFGVANRQVASLSVTANNNASKILEAVSAMPGIKSAAMASIAPGTIGGPRTGIRLTTDPPTQTIEVAKKAFFRIVTPRFMRTARIRIIEGREFAD
ncbi:MAG TPA: ABC transporter permease, partial [Bryobacteraceae bacterium]